MSAVGAAGESLSLPNTLDSWTKVSVNLTEISEKKLENVDQFERLYASIESTRALKEGPKFGALRRVLRDGKHLDERHFFDTLLPWIAGKALQVDILFKEQKYALPLLLQNVQGEVVLTRQQTCCLLALAFFGIFPPPNPEKRFQHFILTYFLELNVAISQRSKLLCILAYFDRIQKAEKEDDQQFLSLKISIERRGLEKQDPNEFWGKSEVPLGPFSADSEGLIEDSHGDLQVDFANEYIGGGVLQFGNVQEEIRFSINPECLVSMLVCESMLNHEAILIRGAEQFAGYVGYGSGFNFTGPVTDINTIDDERNMRRIAIVAIDAMPQDYLDGDEYDEASIIRELNKAYCGFTFTIAGDDRGSRKMRPVATGNWGCGAFGGSKDLKTLQQWMAASVAGRQIKYYSFRDKKLAARQTDIVSLLLEREVTVGQLYQALAVFSKEKERKDLFQFVRNRFTHSHL